MIAVNEIGLSRGFIFGRRFRNGREQKLSQRLYADLILSRMRKQKYNRCCEEGDRSIDMKGREQNKAKTCEDHSVEKRHASCF